jgi:hypothetical protein
VDLRRPANLKLPDGTVLDDVPVAIGHESDVVADTRQFVQSIGKRKSYAFRRVAGPDLHGHERWECPARANEARCPHCALSMYLDPRDVPTITDPPDLETAPSCCTQRTVKLPGTVTPKVRQKLYWGSPRWIRSFARRTHIEGVFGNLKNRNTENVTRGWIQVTGHAKTSLMVAVAATAYNLRVARKWNAETGLSEDPLLQPDPEFYGWREVDADGTVTSMFSADAPDSDDDEPDDDTSLLAA